jgi:aryl-alcohol dehydrogenase-like predicted oxidoreductase
MSEIAHRENIGLLAYSPLAFGVLSGKYLNGARPKGTRLELFGNHFKRYLNGNAGMATESYMKIARKFDLDPVKMSLSFVNTRPFVSSNIIGATNLKQLRQNIESIDYEIPPEALAAIEKVQERFPNPAL